MYVQRIVQVSLCVLYSMSCTINMKLFKKLSQSSVQRASHEACTHMLSAGSAGEARSEQLSLEWMGRGVRMGPIPHTHTHAHTRWGSPSEPDISGSLSHFTESERAEGRFFINSKRLEMTHRPWSLRTKFGCSLKGQLACVTSTTPTGKSKPTHALRKHVSAHSSNYFLRQALSWWILEELCEAEGFQGWSAS